MILCLMFSVSSSWHKEKRKHDHPFQDSTPVPHSFEENYVWDRSMCNYCPCAKKNGIIMRQSLEESLECVYERDLDSFFNGAIECLFHHNGTSCVLSSHS